MRCPKPRTFRDMPDLRHKVDVDDFVSKSRDNPGCQVMFEQLRAIALSYKYTTTVAVAFNTDLFGSLKL